MVWARVRDGAGRWAVGCESVKCAAKEGILGRIKDPFELNISDIVYKRGNSIGTK